MQHSKNLLLMKINTLVDFLHTKYIIIYIKIFLHKKVFIGKNLFIKGNLILDIRQGSKLVIGNNVLLNSRNTGYHINMHSPMKLFADRYGAEITIGENSRIHGTCIHAFKKIEIGKNCLIAANSQIIDGSGHELCLNKPEMRIYSTGKAKEILIGDNVWIGANCIILPGTIIGNGSVIAAGSVVHGVIPGGVLAGGNPIGIIKRNEYIAIIK